MQLYTCDAAQHWTFTLSPAKGFPTTVTTRHVWASNEQACAKQAAETKHSEAKCVPDLFSDVFVWVGGNETCRCLNSLSRQWAKERKKGERR